MFFSSLRRIFAILGNSGRKVPSHPLWRSVVDAVQELFPESLLLRAGEWRVCGSVVGTAGLRKSKLHQAWVRKFSTVHHPHHAEAFFQLRGNISYGISGTSCRVQEGDIVLFESRQARDVLVYPGNRDFEQLWFHFWSPHNVTFNSFAVDGGGKIVQRIPAHNCDLNLGKLVMDAWARALRNPENPLILELLKMLIRSLILKTAEMPLLAGNSDQLYKAIKEQVRLYIQCHLNEPIRLEHLARVAGYSPYFFHRKFREIEGKTPQQFLEEERLTRIMQLLKKNHTLEAIAEETGLSSAAYLTRFFKKHIGLTPGQWRAQCKSRQDQIQRHS